MNIYSTVLFKVMMNHSCIKDQKFSTAVKTALHLASDYLSTNLPFGSQAYFRNLDFISCLGRSILPSNHSLNPATYHYSLVLSTIRAEWANNEKRVCFISSSTVLLVQLTSLFSRRTCSTDSKNLSVNNKQR